MDEGENIVGSRGAPVAAVLEIDGTCDTECELGIEG
jgi:hypothetical protein